jgi:hypothetical protein
MKFRIAVREVEKKEWFPEWEAQDYPDDFWNWINSINESFAKRKYYRPFELYRVQQYHWMQDTSHITDFRHEEDQIEWLKREIYRCRTNSLYACNKYGWLKDGDDISGDGVVKFRSFPAQEIIMYLIDILMSLIIAKGRQIGATSALTLQSIMTINFNKNFFIKYIANSKDKGEEIFGDKIKDVNSELKSRYPWLINPVLNDSKNELRFGKKTAKGQITGMNSRIYVDTPHKNAINGGSPQRSLVDEIGLIDNMSYSPMINEARPTQYRFNPVTGKLELVRQIISWGTGGEMEKGGAQMEVEYKAAKEAWLDKDFSFGIIPIFLDWTARPGATKEIYEKERKFYYRKAEKEKDTKHIIQFHQSWPSTEEDVFMRNSNTMISRDKINAHIARVNELIYQGEIEFGYFDPVYDYNTPYPDHFKVPYRIVGAKWVKTESYTDPMTKAFVRRKPEPWKYRWYQGIDPINSETGKSKFSSSIWDRYHNDIASGVFYREKDYQMCYVQALLQKMYYGKMQGVECETLIENNIGDDLMNFWELLECDYGIMSQQQLPPYMRARNPGKWWGINNKSHNAGQITNTIKAMIDMFGDNIDSLWFWLQVKTFVEKPVGNGSNQVRETRWQAQNKEVDYDDHLFSSVFAYIGAECETRPPVEVNPKKDGGVKKKQLKYVNQNGSLVLAYVDSKGKIVGRPTVKF